MRLVNERNEVPDSTDSLIHLAKSGDATAFERLVAGHYRFIYKAAFRWIGNQSDAEDVTQTVCLRLPDALAGFNGRSKFTSWLYRVTLNAVRDLQRKNQRGTRLVDAVSVVSRTEADATQEQALRVNDIWRIVRQLPEKQRDAILLVFGEEMSQAEAAAIMGCKEVTVSWHIHNARKSLKDLL
ncbi:sigma-70 family RNA polymerase sigma factor [Pseudotabrizicola sp. 4114]|uniref:RNA polymerase sigma factor n=1 Tax=Pseudotabrizicola sp. 4114 TaxID=2817731 RepID=UPI00285E72B4|nr:RNA polymerase sigma-70 factor (ECF subfamily) [Pseudorhodobacter sp. 4114]